MTRRGLLAVAAGAGCGVARAQPIDVGPPLVVVTLRIGPADDTGYLHDLADYTNQHGFVVLGQPGGPQLGERAVFLAWFRRDDGVTMLVTDITAPERMQAFFYPRKDGTAAAETSDLAQAYVRKMASYPAFTAPPPNGPSTAGSPNEPSPPGSPNKPSPPGSPNEPSPSGRGLGEGPCQRKDATSSP